MRAWPRSRAKPTTGARRDPGDGGAKARVTAAARVASAADDADWLPDFVRSVYTANFVHDLDISQPEVLLSCLRPLVPDPQAVLAQMAEQRAELYGQVADLTLHVDEIEAESLADKVLDALPIPHNRE